jgi:hypothetical protein
MLVTADSEIHYTGTEVALQLVEKFGPVQELKPLLAAEQLDLTKFISSISC